MKRNKDIKKIKSFKDFETQKMQLYYQIKLSEKKFEIRSLEIRERFNLMKTMFSITNELLAPLLKLASETIKIYLENYIQKRRKSKTSE